MPKTYFKFCFFLIFTTNHFCKAPREEFNFNFHQSDYNIEVERVEMVRYDKNFVRNLQVRTFKYNRTCTAINTTFTSMVNGMEKVEIIIQAYKFASNEYREFPIRFEFNFCDAMFKNVFGFQTFSGCGNFSKCSVEKGKRYHICNWTIEQSNFPPFIPTGRYMIELQCLYLSHEVIVNRAYAAIERPFGKFH